eukprot:TRINITY_DN3553_c0_g1_i13.p1 TRINITY_DN3553_c0_g1~~TRINITY_DN3553_c0_g1_i13.p1  ORF type:complete len:148 (+),score=20.21 TRINITY_DN3553_c0_g1_i13:62-445(+)
MSDPFPSVYQQNCCSLSFFSERLINCPECGKAILDVTTHSSELSNHVVPGCMVVKPTFGSFLNYSCDSLLHTGISDSKGNPNSYPSSSIISSRKCFQFRLSRDMYRCTRTMVTFSIHTTQLYYDFGS